MTLSKHIWTFSEDQYLLNSYGLIPFSEMTALSHIPRIEVTRRIQHFKYKSQKGCMPSRSAKKAKKVTMKRGCYSKYNIPIGAVHVRNVTGRNPFSMEKQADGSWKRLPAIKKERIIKPPKPKAVKEIKIKPKKVTSHVRSQRAIVKPEKVLKLVANIEGKKLVRVDGKTWKYINVA